MQEQQHDVLCTTRTHTTSTLVAAPAVVSTHTARALVHDTGNYIPRTSQLLDATLSETVSHQL
jgi:hypothetical protein